MRLETTVDGRRLELEARAGETLLDLLRRTGHIGVKDGCGAGDCGSCAVLLDGRAVNACFVFAARADGAEIRTVASLASHLGLHPLQQALLDSGAVQCGFCTPGILMVGLELLERRPAATREEIATALAGNLCRCTGYTKIIDGLALAAARRAGGAP